jgi:DNA-binding transcriptional ArsR family regulator
MKSYIKFLVSARTIIEGQLHIECSFTEEREQILMSKSEHEDFITTKPDVILRVDGKQSELLLEHSEILIALIGKYLTVKDIHRLFLTDPDGPTYSKTLKTVYRHLDTLEEAGLVKVAGHRRHEGRGQPEKLYCRSALIYFMRDREDMKWWETSEGKKQLQTLADLIVTYFKVDSGKAKSIAKLLGKYYEAWNETLRDLLDETSRNEELAQIFSDVDLRDIKSMSGMVSILGVLMKNPEIFEQLKGQLKT